MNYRGLVRAGVCTLLELFTGGMPVAEPKKPHQQSIVLGLRVDDLDRAVVQLKERGVHFLPDPSGAFTGSRWAYFIDHKGNRLEVKELP